MKKVVSLFLAIVMLFSLAACNSNTAELEARVAELEKENAQLRESSEQTDTTQLISPATPEPTATPVIKSSKTITLEEYYSEFESYYYSVAEELRASGTNVPDVSFPNVDNLSLMGNGDKGETWRYSDSTAEMGCIFMARTATRNDPSTPLIEVTIGLFSDFAETNEKLISALVLVAGSMISFDKSLTVDNALEIAKKMLDNLLNSTNSNFENDGIKWRMEDDGLLLYLHGTVIDSSEKVETTEAPRHTKSPGLVRPPDVSSTGATMGEKNALKMAKQYIEYGAFSYTGLIGQLEFEGFSSEEAKYGADNCGADWDEMAVKMADQYLEYGAFSRSGLIEQLVFEGFSQTQAEYAASEVGY